MAKLIINPTSGAKKEIPVPGKVLSIGRDPSNDLVLSDAMVSRRHAILELRGEQYVLRDNNSSNGTLVNGERIATEQPLRDGDLISIGSAKLLFQLDSAPVQAAPPAARPVDTPRVPSGRACPACGSEASPLERYCRRCGKELPSPARQQVICVGCGTAVLLPANFCGVCGKVLLKEEQRHQPTEPYSRGQLQPEKDHPAVPDQPAPSARERVSPPLARSEPPAPSRETAGQGSAAERRTQPPPAERGGALPPSVPLAVSRPPARPAARAAPAATPAAALKQEAPAGFWIRLVAYLIDSVIVGLPMLVATLAWALLFFRQGRPLNPEELSLGMILIPLAGLLVTLALFFAYPLYFWGVRGATPGKKLLGLKVVTRTGESPIGFGRALVRLLGYILNGFLFGIGFLIIAFSDEKLGLHDRLADTRVVRRS